MSSIGTAGTLGPPEHTASTLRLCERVLELNEALEDAKRDWERVNQTLIDLEELQMALSIQILEAMKGLE